MGCKKIKDMNFERWSDGRIKNNDVNHPVMKELLDDTGPGFCLAKWTQVTMHLGNGLTHSCHHPGVHKIPLEELRKNPSALHNTEYKKQRRKEMLNGKRPTECDYCWRIEDHQNNFSDRVYKSIDGFSINDHDKIKEMTGEEDVFPRYVEVSFSNVCNFKCSYCGPNFSSKWTEEIKQQGPYKLEDMLFNGGDDIETHYLNREDNPYTDAFWKWFPVASKEMHTFRITGGEPLLSKHTFKVLDYLVENPNPNLEFAINSNAGVPRKAWEKFTKKVAKLEQANCIKKFTLFASAEATGKQCEFIRVGMNWDEFTSNIKYFLDNTTNTRLTFMSAFNLLSAPTLQSFFKYVLTLKKTYCSGSLQDWVDNETDIDLTKVKSLGTPDMIHRPDSKEFQRVAIDVPYVREPSFLDARILTKEIIEDYLINALDFMIQNCAYDGWNNSIFFNRLEIERFKRIVIDLMIHVRYNDSWEDRQNRRRFYKWTLENEKRNGMNFSQIFPEMKNFYDTCKADYETHVKAVTNGVQ